jgi:alpha/beta hydrolase fold
VRSKWSGHGLGTPSYSQFAEGPWLTKRAMEWFWDAYLPDLTARDQPTATPLRALLPDILPFDHSQAASYRRNGRTFTDDVLYLFLSVLTNGKVTTDGLGPHDGLLVDFPYLGPPPRPLLRGLHCSLDRSCTMGQRLGDE